MIGEINNESKISLYSPRQDVIDLTSVVKEDYATGHQILHSPYLELNDRSVIEDTNRGQTMFNAYVDTSASDPNEEWKWRGTRSMARNKGIAMHANLTGNYLLPLFRAQNDDDEVDKDFSEVMRDIIEWMASPTNSGYQQAFLQIVFGTIQNPVTYLGAEYCEIYQKIKEKTDNGWEVKEVLDEVLSGFQTPVYSSTEVLITNAYERNIQRQKSIIKRRYAEYDELEAKYGQHENWQFVQEGVRSVYSESEGLFYDIVDDEHPSMVAEETWLNRRDDSEVCFVNGIYLGDDNVDYNPIKHRDNRGNPKYNIIPFGYSRIGEHFFYYKSMMNAVGWDNMLYDAMSEIVMNRAILEVEMPMAVMGEDKIDSEVIFPNAVVSLNQDSKISPLLPNSNLVAGFNALRETEKSITEGTVNETISGQLPDSSQKAYSVAQAQSNAKKMIGAVGKSIAESVVQYGDLMKDIALNHYTIPQIDELTSGSMKLKYRQFLVGKGDGSQSYDRKVKFDESLIGRSMSDETKEYEEMKMLEESGYPKKSNSIIRVNPEMAAKFKYLCYADVEEMFTKNQEYWQPVLSALKQQLANDPYVDQKQLTKRLLYAYFQSDGEDMIKRIPELPPEQSASNPLNQMVKAKQNSQIATGMVT